jgi:tetratricopeptide (TPR) repeat protein
VSDACEQLDRFMDGELSAQEAQAFRDHLATCETCSLGLHGEMMLEALEADREPAPGKVGGGGGSVRPIRSSRRWLSRTVAPALLVSVAAAAAWAVWARGHGGVEPVVQAVSPTLESGKTRASEVRIAYAAADAYRPYDVARSGGERNHEDVPLAVLAALEAKGDLHGVAAGLVLSGDDARAESYLARAGASVDVDADRAAVLLDRGEVAQALDALDAVLAKAPSHPQALFNRALSLRDLGLELAAAEAFDKAVALGEKGWAVEAKAQATALRAAHEKRPGGVAGR